MTRYGIEASQRGIDISRAADFQKSLSTDWPILKIAFAQAINTASSTQDVVVLQHNLGYAPPFMVYETNMKPASWGGSESGQYTGAGQSQIYNTGSFSADKNNIYYDANSTPVSFTGYLIVFDHDLTQSVSSPSEHPTAQSSARPNYGVETTRGVNIPKAAFTDFSTTPELRPMTIHKAATITPDATGSFTVAHDLGYLPIFLIYHQKTNGAWEFQRARSTATIDTITLAGVQAPLTGLISYFILKDPLLAVA